MTEYRLYCLDKRGRITHPHDFDAPDDQAALVIADHREHPEHECELWQGQRKIVRLPAKSLAHS